MVQAKTAKLLSKRTIVSLIGIDYTILKETGEENIQKFYMTGLLVIAILLLSFFSVFYAFELMFHMWYAEVFLALFFSLMFFTIYVLLIQTFSKEVLPKTLEQPFFNLSNLSRMGFVFLISFIIAQPIKIFLLRENLEHGIEAYKIQLFDNFDRDLESYHKSDLLRLSQYRNRQIEIYGNNHPSIATIDTQIQFINNRIDWEKSQVFAKIASSDFFVKRILLSNQILISWLIVFLIVALFGFPVFLIYSISSNSRYYKMKKKKDFNLVVTHYSNFKKKYTRIFAEKFSNPGVMFYESYDDAPFNTVKQASLVTMTQDDFKIKFLD